MKARRRAKLSPQEGGRVVALAEAQGRPRARRRGAARARRERAASAPRPGAARARGGGGRGTRGPASPPSAPARELERNRRLAKQGIVSTDLLDQVESASRTTAAAACDAARAGERSARGRHRRGEPRARPDDAARALRRRRRRRSRSRSGEWSTPSPPVDPGAGGDRRHRPVVDLRERAHGRGRLGAPARPGLPARVAIDSHPGQRFPGHVVRVGVVRARRRGAEPHRRDRGRARRRRVRRDAPARHVGRRRGGARDARRTCCACRRRRCSSGDKVLVVEGGAAGRAPGRASGSATGT